MLGKRLSVLSVFIVILLLTGCGHLRDFTVDVSEEEVKNFESAQVVAENYHKIWLMQSGFIRAALGPRLTMLPAAAIEAMDELDTLCEKNFDELTYKEQGASLGKRVLILNEIALKAVQLYAPDVWGVLASIGLGI